MGCFDLPTRAGWFIEIVKADGEKVSDIVSQKNFKTLDDVEGYIKCVYGISKADCKNWSICECSY